MRGKNKLVEEVRGMGKNRGRPLSKENGYDLFKKCVQVSLRPQEEAQGKNSKPCQELARPYTCAPGYGEAEMSEGEGRIAEGCYVGRRVEVLKGKTRHVKARRKRNRQTGVVKSRISAFALG